MSASHTTVALPDDVFRKNLRAVRARLEHWAASVKAVAHIEETETDSYWRLAADPLAEGACPFELIVHDDQHFDLLAGPESYERQPIGNVDLLAEIVEAIGNGRVITRTYESCNTGAVRSVETVITLDDGSAWRRERLNEPLASAIQAEDCETKDRSYVPYRRP